MTNYTPFTKPMKTRLEVTRQDGQINEKLSQKVDELHRIFHAKESHTFSSIGELFRDRDNTARRLLAEEAIVSYTINKDSNRNLVTVKVLVSNE